MNITQVWQMYLRHLEDAASEDIRYIGVLIERDRYIEGLHDKEMQERVETGKYGSAARELGEAFKSAKE